MTRLEATPSDRIARVEASIVELAIAYPAVTEDTPWGHSAFKVRGKTFLFMSTDGEGLSLSMKLPRSGQAALELPSTEPTRYGLGKSGWVTFRYGDDDAVPLDAIAAWIDESFRAIAPKRVVAGLTPR